MPLLHIDSVGVPRWSIDQYCRSTFATELLLAGLADNEAAEILGRETQRVKDIPRKHIDDRKIAASIVERLGEARQACSKTKQEQKL